MIGIDTWLEELLHGASTLDLVLLLSLTLGLRHASDPDHLAAVTTLIASEAETPARRAAMLLGFSWGLGHATTLTVVGLPLVLFKSSLPELVQQGAEVVIGILIVFLAVRLLSRWHRGIYHAHLHQHPGSPPHRHLHTHANGTAHNHVHTRFPRTPLAAYSIGMVHGIGGSAGLTLLLLATIPSRADATAALLVFAAGTAVSMAAFSAGFGWLLARGPIARYGNWAMPVLGGVSFTFGIYYVLGALGVVTYPM